MKGITSVSKRTFAVLMAAVMLFTFAFVNAYAELSFTLTAGNDGSAITLRSSAADCTYTVSVPTGAVYSQKDGLITLSTPAAGAYTVTATKSDSSDTGSVAFTAEQVTLTADLNQEERSMTVSNSASISDMVYFAKGVKVSVNGNFLYNLTAGTEYTIIGYKYDSGAGKLYFGTLTVKLKASQAAPKAVNPTATTNSITVEKIAGAEYKLEKIEGSSKTVVKDWQDSNEFTGLEPGTWYTVSARIKATSDKLASSAVSANIKTYKDAAGKPVEVTFDSVTKNAVTLTPHDGYEYSKDGKTWQDSNKFTGLTADKDYTFYQRIAADADHAASEASKKNVKTNSADIYTADMKNVSNLKWSSEKIRAGKDNSFTLYGDIRHNGNIQWGDTRIVPQNLTDGNAIVYRSEMTVNKEGTEYKGKYHPTSTGNKTITVTYVKEVYKGTDGWEQIGDPIVQTYEVSVLRNDSGIWGLLIGILNVLTGSLPTMLGTLMKWLQEHGASFLLFI